MGYSQRILFDPSKGGNTPGLCLQNTRLGYNIPPLYPNAIGAWNHTEQHADRNFPNLDIPVYFTYKNDGHIGVRLASGQFWSDGKTYTSLEEYEKNHAPKYLGWGESINNVKVIKESFVIEEQPPVFNARYYLDNNPDLLPKYNLVNAKDHWLSNGMKEGRPSAPNFHVKEYQANYADLAGKDYPSLVSHYYKYGINENRAGRKIAPVVDEYEPYSGEQLYNKVRR